MTAIRRLLVANRAEIARRVMRTAREMGIGTVAVYAPPDREAPHAGEADMAVLIPSYLDGSALVSAARRAGADAVHPGYGFLSENAAFAEACVGAGLIWVGPRPDTIRAMADKIVAKQAMVAAGVPVLSEGDPGAGPVVVKAAAGGGGRGMRVVTDRADLDGAVASASREAESAFGDGTVFLERWVPAARHVEVQVFGDEHGNVVALGDRECSIQRRHQKVIEEAPSPGIRDDVRQRMTAAAVAGAKSIGYVGAGTFEFLVDGDEFFFLEVNTRLQVEHPVTEAITGLDLVRVQIEVAQGRPLRLGDVDVSGHAIEARIYAEDPEHGYLPTPGTVSRWRVPDGVRVDSGVEDGTPVPPDYDAMLAKVVAHAPTRGEATARLAAALRGAEIHGVGTNVAQLVAALEHESFAKQETFTDFLEHVTIGPLVEGELRDIHRVAAALALTGERDDVWRFAPRAWRTLGQGRSAPQTIVMGDTSVGLVFGPGDALAVTVGGRVLDGRVLRTDANSVDVELNGVRHRLAVHRDGHRVWVNGATGQTEWLETPRFVERSSAAVGRGPTAPLPGTIVAIEVEAGDTVAEGQLLVVLEAMKMEHRILAPADGVVSAVAVTVGDRVDAGHLLVILESEPG